MEEGRRRLGFQTMKGGYSACVYNDGQLQFLADCPLFSSLGFTHDVIFSSI